MVAKTDGGAGTGAAVNASHDGSDAVLAGATGDKGEGVSRMDVDHKSKGGGGGGAAASTSAADSAAPQTAAGPESQLQTAALRKLKVGDSVDSYDPSTSKWHVCKIVECTKAQVKLHYNGWAARFDRWWARKAADWDGVLGVSESCPSVRP